MGIQDRRAEIDMASPAYQAGFEAGAKVALPSADLLVSTTYPIEVVNGRGGYHSGLLSRPEMQRKMFSPAWVLRDIDPTGDSDFAAIALGAARAKPGFLPLVFPFQQDKVRRRGILDGLDSGVNPLRAFTLKSVYQGAFLASLYAAADGKIIVFGSFNIPDDDAQYERFQAEYRYPAKEVPPRGDFKLSLSNYREKKVSKYIDSDFADADFPRLRYTANQVREILGAGELLSPEATMEWLIAAKALQRAGFAQEAASRRESWSTSPSTRWSGTDEGDLREIKLSGDRQPLYDPPTNIEYLPSDFSDLDKIMKKYIKTIDLGFNKRPIRIPPKQY